MTYYKPMFHFKGSQIWDIIKAYNSKLLQACIDDFVNLRNQACDELNPRYPEWNKNAPKGVSHEEYCKYICGKQTEILNKLYEEKWSKELHVVRVGSDEDCDMYAELLVDPNARIYVSLKPVEEP